MNNGRTFFGFNMAWAITENIYTPDTEARRWECHDTQLYEFKRCWGDGTALLLYSK